MFARLQTQSLLVSALAASASSVIEFYFPVAVRIKRYWAVPSVAEAAHSTQVLNCIFVNAGTDGAGTATLATLTNDSDLADTTLLKLSAWVAHDAKEINTESRPSSAWATDEADEILAGQVIKCTVAKAAGTTTGNVIVGIDYVESD